MMIKQASPEHRGRWAEMRSELWSEATVAEHLAEIDEFLDNRDGRTIAFVALVGDRPIGFVEASLRFDHVNGCDTSPVGFLEGLHVDADARHQGVARALVSCVETWSIDLGCSELGSDTDWENPEGQATHLALGFAETERVIFFRKVLAATR